MKNELTAEEWLALAAYLENPKQSWILSGKVEKGEHRYRTFLKAKEKFIQTAKEIESHA